MTPRRAGRGSLVAAAVLLLAAASPARGHELSRSVSRLEVGERQVRAILTLDLLQFPGVDRDGDGQVSYDELDAALDGLYATLGRCYRLSAAGVAPTRTTLERADIVQDGHVGEIELAMHFPSAIRQITVRATLFEVAGPDHRHFVSATLHGSVRQAILDAGTPSIDLAGPPGEGSGAGRGPSRAGTFWSFLRLGVEHIATGYDHLAFLVCLLVGASSRRSLVAVVTSFTVAHSLTLALATFDVVVLPTRLTETLIALSIAYVALENLRDARGIERYRVTFLFGLIHGFGFSNVLREMQLPPGGFALSLFSFNLGVEIGQVVFVLVLFPVLAWLTARGWVRLRPAVSIGVAALAVYWFVERALGG